MMKNEIKLEESHEERKTGFRKFLSILWISFGWAFLSALVIGCLTSGIWTIIPTELLAWGSSKVNLIGYVSHCSYVPFSTSILLGAAAIGSILIMKMKSRKPIGIVVFACTAIGTGVGMLGGIDIITFAGMGAGVGVGWFLALLIGLFSKVEA